MSSLLIPILMLWVFDIGSVANAQNIDTSSTTTFLGKVIDSTTGDEIEGVNIALFSEDEQNLVTGTITERDGSFLFEKLMVKSYVVRISYIGYKTKKIELTNLEENTPYNHGWIHLDRSQEEMDEVTVTAEREAITFETDRTTLPY